MMRPHEPALGIEVCKEPVPVAGVSWIQQVPDDSDTGACTVNESAFEGVPANDRSQAFATVFVSPL
jgi:hypothetical protein